MKIKSVKNAAKALLLIIPALFLINGIAYLAVYDVCGYYRIEKYDNYDYEAMKLNNDEKIYELSAVEMSQEDMREDIDYFFDLMESSQPNIYFYEQLYGFDMDKLRSKCRAETENINSEAEFYGYISAVVNMLPSCHSAVIPPDFDSFEYCSFSYLNAFMTMNDSELIGYTNGWEKIISGYYENASYASEGFAAQYIDGKYYITSAGEEFSEYIDGEIISINGGTPENYVKENITGGKLKYDFKNEGIYYDALFFYPCQTPTAKKISMEIRTREGTFSDTEVYSDYVRNAVTAYYLNHCESGENNNISSPPSAYYFNDGQRNITYIALPMLTASSGEIYEILQNIKNDNIIVDLRYCPGGEISFTVNEVYPALFDRDAAVEFEVYTPYSKPNRRFSENYGIKNLARDFFAAKKYDGIFPDSNSKYVAEKRTIEFKGSSQNHSNVYLLIGGNTASAADLLSAAAKESGAVLIGSNTSGEGMVSGVYIDKLPNSRLMFSYIKEFTSIGNESSNSVYGTAPHIYSAATAADYCNFTEIADREDDPYTYENRLEWDSALNAAIEMIGKGDEQ